MKQRLRVGDEVWVYVIYDDQLPEELPKEGCLWSAVGVVQAVMKATGDQRMVCVIGVDFGDGHEVNTWQACGDSGGPHIFQMVCTDREVVAIIFKESNNETGAVRG